MGDLVEWGRSLAVNGRWIVHLDWWIVAKVVSCYAPGEFKDNRGNAIDVAVLGLDGGHTVTLVDRDRFLVLEHCDVMFTRAIQEVLNKFLVEAGKMGTRMGVRPDTGIALLRAMLQRQSTALGAITTTENING